MALSYSVARWTALLAFIFDFAAQQYGMFSTPNMKTIHDQNLSFFSPQPFFIAGFFFPQQIIQIIWLYRLWKLDHKKSKGESEELDTVVAYVPYYAIGNMSIGIWMFFWNASHLKLANLFVCINTVAQLYFVTIHLQRMDLNSRSSVLTHMVSKTFAGIGVLDILHNTSVAYFKDQPATLLVRVLTGVGFGLAGVTSDWIFGACLVYDLIALAAGQSSSWRILLGAYAVATGVIVAAKNIAKPPYENYNRGYETVDDSNDNL